MPTRGTVHRTFRCEGELWERAKEKAAERGESLSDVLREAVRAYVDRDD